MATDPRDEHDDAPDADAHEVEAEDRAAILNRRAVFIASAIAGLTLASCDGNTQPQPCLDMAVTGGAGAGGEPQPCLSMDPTTTGTGGTGGAQPCLGMTMGGSGGVGGTSGPGGAGGGGAAGGTAGAGG